MTKNASTGAAAERDVLTLVQMAFLQHECGTRVAAMRVAANGPTLGELVSLAIAGLVKSKEAPHDSDSAQVAEIARLLNVGSASALGAVRHLLRVGTNGWYDEQFALVSRLADALRVVLPMAKGYAAEHPVGNNAAMVGEAEALLLNTAAPCHERSGGFPVVADILAEVERATKKFPTWPTDPLHAVAVLGEEFGELTKAALQLTYEPHKTSAEEVRTEAIQTAAMALRFAMSLGAYLYQPGEQHAQQAVETPPPRSFSSDCERCGGRLDCDGDCDPTANPLNRGRGGVPEGCTVVTTSLIKPQPSETFQASPEPFQGFCGVCGNTGKLWDGSPCTGMCSLNRDVNGRRNSP